MPSEGVIHPIKGRAKRGAARACPWRARARWHQLTCLIPQKRAAAELGVSRSSLWRARASAIAGFPPPVILRARVYWRTADLPGLKAALERFEGRRAFEQEHRHAKARAALTEATGLKPKRRKRAATLRQPDLFAEADAAAPPAPRRLQRPRSNPSERVISFSTPLP